MGVFNWSGNFFAELALKPLCEKWKNLQSIIQSTFKKLFVKNKRILEIDFLCISQFSYKIRIFGWEWPLLNMVNENSIMFDPAIRLQLGLRGQIPMLNDHGFWPPQPMFSVREWWKTRLSRSNKCKVSFWGATLFNSFAK